MLRGAWGAWLPAVLAVLCVRYLTVAPEAAEGSAVRILSGVAADSPVLLVMALFLAFALVARYWMYRLPFGESFVDALDGGPVVVGRRPVADCAEAVWLVNSLSHPKKSRDRARLLSAEGAAELDGALAGLRAELSRLGDGSLSAPIAEVRRAGAPVLRAWQGSELIVLGGGVVAAIGFGLALRAYVAEVHVVRGSSMLPTLEAGDRVLVNKFAYRLTGHAMPKRGDLVVFALGEAKETQRLVKRVVGLPGDTVRMRGGFLQVNTWEVASCRAGLFTHISNAHGTTRGQVFVEFLGSGRYLTVLSALTTPFEPGYTVKPGEVFVLGDNRNASNDSRTWNGGKGAGVPLTAILGRVDGVLTRALPDGSLDLSRLIGEPALHPHVFGADLSDIEAGIKVCLEDPPRETDPPAPAAEARTPLRRPN